MTKERALPAEPQSSIPSAVALLPETRAFLRDWLDWVERGAPDGQPYSREDGLCDNAWDHWETGCLVAGDLEEAFDGRPYPFGLVDFGDRVAHRTQHECPLRLAFARANATGAAVTPSQHDTGLSERRNERCEHGIRWPWACHECDEAAWAEHLRREDASNA